MTSSASVKKGKMENKTNVFQMMNEYLGTTLPNTPLSRTFSKLNYVVHDIQNMWNMSQSIARPYSQSFNIQGDIENNYVPNPSQIEEQLLPSRPPMYIMRTFAINIDPPSQSEQKRYQLERIEFNEENHESKECFICRSEFIQGEIVLRTTCCNDHLIHTLCAIDCIQSTNSKCPFCRQTIYI